MQRTHDWLVRSVNSHDSSSSALFGIVQGGVYSDLRKESCFFLVGLDSNWGYNCFFLHES